MDDISGFRGSAHYFKRWNTSTTARIRHYILSLCRIELLITNYHPLTPFSFRFLSDNCMQGRLSDGWALSVWAWEVFTVFSHVAFGSAS